MVSGGVVLALLVILGLLAVSGLRVSVNGWSNPFCRRHMECSKGIFIGCVFISHLWGYLDAAEVSLPGDWMATLFLGVPVQKKCE